jgi:hypothetical protein
MLPRQIGAGVLLDNMYIAPAGEIFPRIKFDGARRAVQIAVQPCMNGIPIIVCCVHSHVERRDGFAARIWNLILFTHPIGTG